MAFIDTSRQAHTHKILRQQDIGPMELIKLQRIKAKAKKNPPQEITQETIDRAMAEYKARQEQ
jgi:hypothetical protein